MSYSASLKISSYNPKKFFFTTNPISSHYCPWGQEASHVGRNVIQYVDQHRNLTIYWYFEPSNILFRRLVCNSIKMASLQFWQGIKKASGHNRSKIWANLSIATYFENCKFKIGNFSKIERKLTPKYDLGYVKRYKAPRISISTFCHKK